MGQERRNYAIVSWGFGWGGICACELFWVDNVGMGEECSGSGKLFKHFVDIIFHLYNFFNERLGLWTVV